MIIDNATIRMQSGHYQLQRSQRTESLTIKRSHPERPQKDQLKLSDTARAARTKKNQLDIDHAMEPIHSLSMQIIRRMVKDITGQEIKLFSPAELQGKVDEIKYQEAPQAPQQPSSADVGLVYQQSISYFESESTAFSAEGTISTKDGQSIAFSVSLSMSRSYFVESNLSIKAGAGSKTDPLVINFDGTAAELSSTFFEFDIDADGSPDQIATLKSNSGMLALDKNQDGVVNDGSELFGPETGNGFQELAAFDDDHNQFIDEGDAIYERLRIWQRHADGSQQLVALGEKNIGAIYLGHATTPFQLKADDNTSLGDVASSGIYLTEQSGVGTVQQINFTA